MKFSALIILLFSFYSVALGQSKDRITDFREIYWGTPLDSTYRSGFQVNFEIDKTSPEKKAYKIPGDNMKIGSVDLNRINYIFNGEKKLYKILLEGPREQAQYMTFIIEHKFGDYDKEIIDNTEVRTWKVQDVIITMYLHEFRDFQVYFESDWEAAEAYEENTSVEDF
ncbi:MAG: hypothetical protein WD048_08680 [Chitinophagales bacterium]